MLHDEIEDIYDFYQVPFWQTTWFAVSMAVLFVGICVLSYYLITLRRKRVLKPWQVALQKLQALSVDECVTKQDFKKVYFEITVILKYYLQQRYGWNILDKTDDELVLYLTKQKFDELMLTGLTKLLSGATWIKYANQVALKTQVTTDLLMVISFIQKTIPAEK